MEYNIEQQKNFVEIHVSGKVSHWDLLRIVHELHKKDPKKQTPDLWVLDRELEFSLHSFPVLAQGLLKLMSRALIKNGCKSAILAADEFQRATIDFYCTEASSLPYEIKAFTSRIETLDWLLN